MRETQYFSNIFCLNNSFLPLLQLMIIILRYLFIAFISVGTFLAFCLLVFFFLSVSLFVNLSGNMIIEAYKLV